jgi:hypothetical protein
VHLLTVLKYFISAAWILFQSLFLGVQAVGVPVKIRAHNSLLQARTVTSWKKYSVKMRTYAILRLLELKQIQGNNLSHRLCFLLRSAQTIIVALTA